MSNPWSSLATQTFGEGPLVVWVHGLGESSLRFREISRHPGLQGYRHRLIDLPGYGKTEWPAEAYRLDEAATQLAGWLDQGGEPAIVIGHSMGGVIGQLIAEKVPTAVRAFINVEGNLSLADCGMSAKVAAFGLEAFLSRGFAELHDSTYRSGVDHPELRGSYVGMSSADPRVLHRHSVDLVEMSTVEDLAPRLAACKPPSLYLAGSPDGASARSKELLVAAVARWQVIESAGHWPFFDQPDAFVAAVNQFVKPIIA
jgi:pimeloyl-ACP methyl ester carboxylesterase